MDQKELYTEYWKLLNRADDYFKFGKETNHRDLSEFTVVKQQEPMVSIDNNSVGENIFPSEDCGNCSMSKAGRRAVPVLGNIQSDLWVITDSPSLEAEKLHCPLGPDEMDYFHKWMTAIELNFPEDMCLQNLTRCRPPGSRPPFPDEFNRCAKDLESRLKQHQPKVILSLGSFCSAWLTGQRGMKVGEMRGRLYEWKGIPLVVSYSPEQVLNSGELKRPVWEDLKNLRNLLNGS
jgi:DNA polymerase